MNAISVYNPVVPRCRIMFRIQRYQKSVSALDEEESADAKTRREDVLNQLMTLLNTAYTSGKKTEAEDAIERERPKAARVTTQQQQQVGGSPPIKHNRCTWVGEYGHGLREFSKCPQLKSHELQVQLSLPGEDDDKNGRPSSIVGGEQQIDYVHGSLGMVPMHE